MELPRIGPKSMFEYVCCQGAAKGDVIKGVFTNANERAQTWTNADFRLSEKEPKTQVNAHKREQTQPSANIRKIKELHALLRTPFLRQPNVVFK